MQKSRDVIYVSSVAPPHTYHTAQYRYSFIPLPVKKNPSSTIPEHYLADLLAGTLESTNYIDVALQPRPYDVSRC